MDTITLKIRVTPDGDKELWEHLSAIPSAGPGVKGRASTFRKLALLGLMSLRDKGLYDQTTFTDNGVPSRSHESASGAPDGNDGTLFSEKSVPSRNWPVREKSEPQALVGSAEQADIPNVSNAQIDHTPSIRGAGVPMLAPARDLGKKPANSSWA